MFLLGSGATSRTLPLLVGLLGGVLSVDASSAQVPRFSLDTPRFVFGSADGPRETTLAGVTGVVRLDADRIVIAEATSPRLSLLHTATGKMEVWAREGPGPGELQYPFWAGRCRNGSVAVFDAQSTALVVYDGQGHLRARHRLPEAARFNDVLRCGRPPDLWMAFRQPTGSLETRGIVFQVPVVLARLRAGGVVDTLGRIGEDSYFIATRVGGFSAVPFAPAIRVAAGVQRIFVSQNVTGRVEVLDTLGSMVASWVVQDSVRVVRKPDWARAVARFADSYPLRRTRELFRNVLSEVEQPDRFPVIDAIRADSQDRLWVRSFAGFRSDRATWWVFDERGRQLAEVDMPRGLSVMEIGPDYLLGVETDSLGVERVVEYALPAGIR